MAIPLKFNPKEIFHINQLIVWENFLQGGVNVIAAGRRFGKSYMAMYILFLFAMSKMGNYFWVAPSYKMMRDPYRRMKKLVIRTLKGKVKVNETDKRMELPNGSIIEFHSADDPQSLRSQGLRGAVLDECSKMQEEAWTQGIKPSLTDYDDSWAILIGTPYGINWFSKIWDDGQVGKNSTRSWRFTSYDNPKISKTKIDLDKLTMSDFEFRQEHLAEFLSDTGFVFDRKNFNQRAESVDVYARYLSFDTASTTGKGSAFTSCTVGELDYQKRLFIREVVREKVEFVELESMLERLFYKYNTDGKLDGIIIENASSGIALIQTLYATAKQEIAELVIPFNPKLSKRQRAQQASKWVEKGRVIFPRYSDETKWLIEFEDELVSFVGDNNELKDQVDSFSQLCLCLTQPLSEGILYGKQGG